MLNTALLGILVVAAILVVLAYARDYKQPEQPRPIVKKEEFPVLLPGVATDDNPYGNPLPFDDNASRFIAREPVSNVWIDDTEKRMWTGTAQNQAGWFFHSVPNKSGLDYPPFTTEDYHVDIVSGARNVWRNAFGA